MSLTSVDKGAIVPAVATQSGTVSLERLAFYAITFCSNVHDTGEDDD